MCKLLRIVIEALLLAMTIKQTGQLERPQGADKCMLFQMLKKIKFYDWDACGITTDFTTGLPLADNYNDNLKSFIFGLEFSAPVVAAL